MKLRRFDVTKSSSKASLLHRWLLLLFMVTYWVLSGVVLWCAYDIEMQIGGGYYKLRQAIANVAAMGLIITILTGLVWFQVTRNKNQKMRGWLSWSVTWKTAVCLIVYTSIVVVWRQSWTPRRGLSDSSMFLPVIGYINARFFSEAGPLIFLVYVVPIIALISGLLYRLQARISGNKSSSQLNN